MGRCPGAYNDDLDSSLSSRDCILAGLSRRAMGREDARLIRDAKIIESLFGLLHYL
jgi:hypothetical protein